jgi:hypothetical protein
VALERFCERVFEQIDAVRNDASQTPHERYLKIYRLLQDRDEQMAHAFNRNSRSQMIFQLLAINALGILEPDELKRFSSKTQETIESLAKFAAS